MINTYYCSSEEFVKNSKIPVRVMETEPDMMEEIAELMAATIEENNAKGEKTVIICPVGPIGQYPIFAKKVNDRKLNEPKISLVNEKIGKKFTVSYSGDTLPDFVEWKSMASGDYVLGLEPCTTELDDRFAYRTIQKGAQVQFCVNISIEKN